jgi:hypothetical protein
MGSNGASDRHHSRGIPRTILSGPPAELWRAARVSSGRQDITCDIGGTSTDVALIRPVAYARAETMIAGLPLKLPQLDINTVRAGGGASAGWTSTAPRASDPRCRRIRGHRAMDAAGGRDRDRRQPRGNRLSPALLGALNLHPGWQWRSRRLSAKAGILDRYGWLSVIQLAVTNGSAIRESPSRGS